MGIGGRGRMGRRERVRGKEGGRVGGEEEKGWEERGGGRRVGGKGKGWGRDRVGGGRA